MRTVVTQTHGRRCFRTGREVEDRHTCRLAEEIVEQCQGVREVHNNLKPRRGLMDKIGAALSERGDREVDRTTGHEGTATTDMSSADTSAASRGRSATSGAGATT
jgi:hypothetical protein